MIQGIVQLFDCNKKNNKTTPLTSDPRSKPELVSVLRSKTSSSLDFHPSHGSSLPIPLCSTPTPAFLHPTLTLQSQYLSSYQFSFFARVLKPLHIHANEILVKRKMG